MVQVEALVYEEYEELVVTDTTPPSITLIGLASVELLQMDTYNDEGASAFDNINGFLSVTVAGADAVNTCCVTDPAAPFSIVYTAQDAAGNQALPVVRTISVLSACVEPSYLCEGLTGGGTVVCATCEEIANAEEGSEAHSCMCVDTSIITSSTEQADSEVEEYQPPADTTPPEIQLLGDVDTSVVTPSDAPYVVTYSVSDAAGNAALEVRRRIVVTNPCAGAGDASGVEETSCGHDDEGNVLCSEGGLCLRLSVDEEVEETEAEPPVLSLMGPATVTFTQGTLYAACAAGVQLVDQVCDRGATATDPVDGDLTSLVLACSPDGVANRFEKKGITGCSGLDVNVPGTYTIEFSVHNSKKLVAVIERNVTVLAVCSIGEDLCSDGITCSEGGLCLGDLDGGAASAVEEVPVDAPPVVTLRSTAAVPDAVLEVKQYAAYEACSEEELQQNRSSLLCEPGANATDDQAGDLTAKVLSCPPDSCLSTGCAGHEFVKKGMAGCINTSSAVGTIFNVTFLVFDTAQPAQSASTSRTITIISPCETGEELCSDFSCSAVDCSVHDAWVHDDADTSSPMITILTTHTRVRYGDAESAALLLPCVSLADATDPPQCSAVAEDDKSGDVTPSLIATQDTICSGCSAVGCALASIHQCVPGLYGYILEAFDEAGNRGVARLIVTVAEEAEVSTVALVAAGTTSSSEAWAQAGRLLNGSTAENEAFREGMANLLNDGSSAAGEDVTADDIAVREVIVQDANGQLVEADATNMALELHLAVNFTSVVAVASVEDSDEGEGGARLRRHLAQYEGEGSLEARSNDVAAVLEASATNGEMSAALAKAATDANATLSTEVAGLSGNVSSSSVSPEVDELAAFEVSIRQEMENLKRGSDQMAGSLASVEAKVELAGGDPGGWETRLNDLWQEVQQGDFDNAEALLTSIEELQESLQLLIDSIAQLGNQAAVQAEEAEEVKGLEETEAYTETAEDVSQVLEHLGTQHALCKCAEAAHSPLRQ
ncbi:hypothetical protein CYMTET_9956 [Cymbomonas tetramitiformis]|uniref:Pesticidal crystal protein Cry22Aa Ig-like domain-containing protein n=1 Tax=Cymbomonas tetramitiformis TaxID=36881 RepID=A0AAE0LEB3_9CHLO|nr:hypothetical protein CYMTET_9956 [Cymbomonas tetramitiformis]